MSPHQNQGVTAAIKLHPMKNIITFLLVLISLSTYSQSRDEIVKSKLDSKLKQTFPNPSTYEFVSLTPSGTITHLHNIYLRTDEIKRQIEANELDLQLKL